MKPDAFKVLVRSLERVDRGGQAPRLASKIGSFLRHYQSCRNDFAKLAIRQGIQANRNGEIPGDGVGSVSLVPMTAVVAPRSVSTQYGAFFSIPVMCPELLCIIDLRLWSNSGSGIAGLNLLDSLMDGEVGLTLSGGYRWLPPIRIMPGIGQFNVLERTGNDSWSKLEFLKYSGEDIMSDPFPLEYRPLWIDREPRLAAIRVVAGISETDRLLVVPYAMSSRSVTLQLKLAQCTTPRARECLSQKAPVSCLLFKEPPDETWTIWDMVSVGPDGLQDHLIAWSEYLDRLRMPPIWGDRANMVEAARASLSMLNIEAHTSVDGPCQVFGSHAFARTLAGRIRFSAGIGLGQVGPIL